MAEYDETTYGERIAEVYDLFYGRRDNPETVADFLAPLAGKRRTLELGIGTVVMGNFADVKVSGGGFGLVYVAFSTLFALRNQDEQLRCFQHVAKRILPAGAFVVEAFNPDHSILAQRQRVTAVEVGTDHALLDLATNDVVNQTVRAQHILFTAGGVQMYPVQLRFAYPSELDLMARLSGMRLRERYGGWDRSRFTAASPVHISVYELQPKSASASPRITSKRKSWRLGDSRHSREDSNRPQT